MATEQQVRYSDEELQEFKELILKQIDEAQAIVDQCVEKLHVDESDPTFKMLEEGASTREKEDAAMQAQRQMAFIKKLKAALVRIENKTYGVCRITGKLIPKGRLLAVPHATLSIEGKEIEERNRRG
ncbi:MAG: TraR/DksA C4-type zinc finger protein [Muribaculaceae bacterium]|nr:TraR/DksA C4-type zinc finger protein [Muribaculaceae bacterium]